LTEPGPERWQQQQCHWLILMPGAEHDESEEKADMHMLYRAQGQIRHFLF
jgi:hypothetical protein